MEITKENIKAKLYEVKDNAAEVVYEVLEDIAEHPVAYYAGACVATAGAVLGQVISDRRTYGGKLLGVYTSSVPLKEMPGLSRDFCASLPKQAKHLNKCVVKLVVVKK